MYLVSPLRRYLLHLVLFLLFLQSKILKKNLRNSKDLSYLTDRHLCYTKITTEQQKKSHTKGVADKSNSKKAALLTPFATLKEQATLKWTGSWQTCLLM